MIAVCCSFSAAADDTIRIATWHSELSRKHPTLLYRDLARNRGDGIPEAVDLIIHARPDVLTLQGIDYDYNGLALAALAQLLADAGWPMPHSFAAAPNSGVMTDVDLNGDGRVHDPQDAQSYGWFSGQGGMAVLSKLPIVGGDAGLSDLIWADIPWATPPRVTGAPFPSAEAWEIQKLSTTGHWQVTLETTQGPMQVFTSHHTPPVFDGPEDRNGLRNADELRLWQEHLPSANQPWVLLGNFNLDAKSGEGRRAVMAGFLKDARLQDPEPIGPDGTPKTVDFGGSIGPLRVSYVLPATCWSVADAGQTWPKGSPGDGVSRHGLVWVDLVLDGRCDGSSG